ncbi:hypothetical protein AGLY_016374 [Aphis glycines]|uniref:Reverse transcriptase domain-containing protein n=1 Tax=Aphis glycines TaxID=307491 RepID=A0A6G0SZZ7_APHGL|nr:hypothetical protein AGLY_016374 [Aphis glycines]
MNGLTRFSLSLSTDVDRDVESSKLSGMIMEQNPELGLEKESVVPLFMKGSKAEEQVWWVCSVRPSHFRTVVGKSLYIGMSRCRVKEYVDIVRCFKCQRFGHRAAMCQAKVDTCGRCAVQGHRARDCQGGPVNRANGVEVLLLQEVLTSGERLIGFDYGAVKTVFSCRDGSAGAAIVVLNQDIEVVALQGLCDRYCAVASLRKRSGQAIVFVSAYFKYSIPTRVFTDRLGDVLDRINQDVLIGADVNAHSPQWFSRPGNNSGSARGTHVESLIAEKHLTVHNQPGHIDTYERPGMGSSNIDVTLTRGGSLANSISEWEVLDVTDSDHRTIRFKIHVGSGPEGPTVGKSRFNVRKADWDRFRLVLAQKVFGDPETMVGDCGRIAESLTRALEQAMEASMPRSRKSGRTKPPWWDAGLEESKRRLNNFRRTKDYKVSDRGQFRTLRNEHLKKIRRAKMESWRKFATSINSDIWGPVYRWARNGSMKSRVPNAVLRGDGTFTVTALETAECLLESLIPRDEAAPVFDRGCVGRVRPEVTEAEVKSAVWRMAPNKAPGLDGITAGVLRKAWGVIGTPLTNVLTECLRKSVFPDCWKTAEVVVIKKGEDRDPSLPKSYRPVSLLSVPSKVLERLVVDRLEAETGGALSAEQHGFRAGKSTISAIKSCLDWVDNSEDMVVGIFLDISGAFDNLRWNVLIRDMMDLGASDATRSIIQSYLTGRRAVLSVEGATAFADLTRGCPQGSQLGPSLWNLSMDRALVTNDDDRVKLIAYADDLAVLIAGSDLGEIQGKARATLGALCDWASQRGLTFSASKSQAIPLKGGLRPGFTVPFGTEDIVAVCSVRYLGVELDSRRNFWAHVSQVAGKSDSLYSRLRAASSADWAKGTGLEKSAGKEDPVELDSNLALFGDMPRCSISGSRGSRRAVSRPSVSPSTLKYHYSHRFPTYSVERNARFRPRVRPAVGRRPVASSARRRFVRRAIGARRGRRAVGLCPFVPGRAPAEGSGRQTADRVRARAAGRQKSPSACAALPRARALVRSVFRGHRQVGSLTGAVHLSKNNAGVLRPAQRGRKPRVEQKGKCWLDPGRSVRVGTAKASASRSSRPLKSFQREVSEKLPQG